MKTTKWEKLVERRGDFWKNYMMIISLQKMKDVFGFTLKEHLTTREGIGFTHWMSTQAVNQFSRRVEAEIESNPKFSQKIFRIFTQSQKNLIKFNKRLINIDLQKLSDKQLQKIFLNFYEKYLALYPSFHIGVYAKTIEEAIKRWLFNKLSKENLKDKFNEYLADLIASEQFSLLEQEKLDLISIARQIKKFPTQKDILITRHAMKYAGLPVIHDDIKPWGRSYFSNRLNKLLKASKIQLQKQYREIVKNATKVKKNKKDLYASLSIPKKIQQYCAFIGQSTWIRLTGRQTFSLAHHASRELFKEIGRRFGLSGEDVKWLNPNEILKLIDNGTLPSTQKLENRKRISVLLFHNNQYFIFEGREAKKTIKKELGEKYKPLKKEKTILKGATAFPGLVSGKAKIIFSEKEIAKIKNGDILITRMTTTDIIPAVRKAAAIVTDEGGITCHAAIISRELKIPCIVGTQLATKTIHDNDTVSINATKGIVKIIRK